MATTTLNTRVQMKHDTTANWAKVPTFRGLAGEIIIYDDRYSYEVPNGDGTSTTIYVPGIKICDGNAYLADLPFIDYMTESRLTSHINDTTVHITAEERSKWNDKMNSEEQYNSATETLTLTK